MCMQGLDIRLEARAVRIDDRSVTLGNGEIIPAGTVICTIGTKPSPLRHRLGAAEGARPRSRQRGHVRARVRRRVGARRLRRRAQCSSTARSARRRRSSQIGRLVSSHTTSRQSCGASRRAAFSFKPVGQLATIGHNKAVAEMFGLRISGFVAWLLWRGVYLLKRPDVRAQDAAVPRMELGDVLSAGHCAPGISSHQARNQRGARREGIVIDFEIRPAEGDQF